VFESLTEKFSSVFRSLSGRGRITEANVSDAMRDVRKALLEADVNYNIVKQFCKDVREAALGAEVVKSLHPGQVMIKIVNDELNGSWERGHADYFVRPGRRYHAGGPPGLRQDEDRAKLGKYLVSKGRNPCWSQTTSRDRGIEQLRISATARIPVYRSRPQGSGEGAGTESNTTRERPK
jgi:signal recognition particle subunit SRP54